MIRETDVDGVHTLIAPVTGPMRAGLVFRVGIADETLSRRGITHLVEHLALYRHGLADYHFNGATGSTATQFFMQGTEDDLVAFINGVCDSLAEPPMERLATEKEILRTEERTRGTGVNHDMALWRHGARTYGLASYPEWGLSAITEDEVRAWTQTWFTRENAVLWIAGPDLPAGLKLHLPEGPRRPLPEPTSTLPVTPAYFCGGDGAIVLDAIVPRGAASTVYTRTLERLLYRDLRQDGGFSYTAAAVYDTPGGQTASVTAMADALPDKREAAIDGFVAVFKRLAAGDLDQSDVDAAISKYEEALQHPDADAQRLPAKALNLLTGYPDVDLEQIGAEVRAVTVEDVRATAEQAWSTALLMVPQGHLERHGLERAPTWSRFAVTGASHRSRLDHDVRLVVGQEGVSLISPVGPVTVRYAECAVMLRWPDGGRQLIGEDAIGVRIEPIVYGLGAQALAQVDASVSGHVVVDMPARDAAAIPTVSVLRRWRTRLGRSAHTFRRRRAQFKLWRLTNGSALGVLGWSVVVLAGLAVAVAAAASGRLSVAVCAVLATIGLIMGLRSRN
jgi:predicted Zn-dependent peptidase